MVTVEPPAPFRILYEDEHLIAVAKPSGWAVHPGWAPRERSLLGPLSEQMESYLYPVHRLDRGTSGIVVFARHRDAARHLNEQFSQRAVQKRYLAWVRGHPKDQSGYLDHAIPRREGGERVPAQTAWLHLESLDTSPRESSLVAFAPRTGRMHQVRRHARHLNHPLLGDSRYGRPKLNRAFRKAYGLKRLALHAWALEVTHPSTDAKLRFVCELPVTFARPLQAVGYLLPNDLDPWSLLFPKHEETSAAPTLNKDHHLR